MHTRGWCGACRHLQWLKQLMANLKIAISALAPEYNENAEEVMMLLTMQFAHASLSRDKS